MPERVLTQRELNRTMLARQLLLERRRRRLPRVVEQMGCVQSQYAPSTYVGLWSRVEGLARDAVTRALEERTLVQSTLMRSTIHVVSRRDYWPLAIAIREERRAWSRRVQGADERVLRRAADRLRGFLADGPRSQKEIAAAGLWLPGIGLWANVVRAPPAGTWERRRADLFGLAEQWAAPSPSLPSSRHGSTSSAATSARSGRRRERTSPTGPAWASVRSRRRSREWSCAASGTIGAASCSTFGARRFRPPRLRFRCGSSRPGTRPCSCRLGAPGSSRTSIAAASSNPATRSPSGRSSSTGRWPGPGVPRKRACGWSRSAGSTAPSGRSSKRRPSG